VSEEHTSESHQDSAPRTAAGNDPRRADAVPLRIALIYLIVGASWAFLSDRLLLWLQLTPAQITSAQTLKSWAFILLSALLIFFLLHRHQRRDQQNVRQLIDTRAQLERVNAELEARVTERTRQLEFANRELESFAYAVSHDLRAPLRSMSGFSQLLRESAPETLDDKSRHYLQRIHESSQRMSSLIDDLLSLSRIGRSDFVPRPTNLTQIATDIVNALRERNPERTVTVDIAPGLQAQGDTRLLRIAFENLLDNAWKYTSQTDAPHISVGVERSEHGDVFFVRDNGVGFDMQYAGKLFAPFQRLHAESQFPGTGIGLVTVQRIVARHGGRIWVDATPDAGATFYFTLSEDRTPVTHTETGASTTTGASSA
jgi:light-regulated signal transduction histidine kinase (bacteriophytochrome)